MVSLDQKITLAIDENDLVKLVLEFLENRRIHISQVSLERESGIVNGAFSDDLLFLRQLILDGQWASTLQFVEPLKELEGFPSNRFHFLCKFFELLCIKQEPGPLQNNEFAVEEIVECLKELENLCESAEEFRKLCSFLTLPKLSEHEHFRSWNPYSAVLPLVADFIDGLSQKSNICSDASKKHSTGDRLVQLVVKGLLYEYALTFCQRQALEGKNASTRTERHFELFSSNEKLSSADLSLISWLEMLGNEQFTIPFKQKELFFRVNHYKKPSLEAQWSEQILATPIKPGGQFPYSMVPFSKPKFAQKVMAHSMTASLISDPGRRHLTGTCFNHTMSQSTLPSVISFSIHRPSDGLELDTDVMRQSQTISDMLSETSSNPLPFNTNQSKQHTLTGCRSNNDSLSTACSQVLSPCSDTSHETHQQLEAFYQRNHLKLPFKHDKIGQLIVHNSLAPVPELDTPVGEGGGPILSSCTNQNASDEHNLPNMQSRLFQQFQALQNQQQNQTQHFSGCFERQSFHYDDYAPLFAPFCFNTYHKNMTAQLAQPNQSIPIRPNAFTTTNLSFPTMSTRPTSMPFIPSEAIRTNESIENDAVRPKSFLDNPLGSNQFSPDYPSILADQKTRSIDDDEPFFDDVGEEENAENVKGKTGQEHEKLLKFVPICCYEDDQAIRAVAFHPSGGYFAIGTNSRNLLICRYPQNDSRTPLYGDYLLGVAPPPNILFSKSKHHRGSVYCAAFNQTGNLLATGSNDKTIKLMAVQIDSNNCQIGVEMDIHQVHDGTVRDLLFMEDRISTGSSCSTLISGGAGSCRLYVTSCETGRTVRSFQEHTAPILGLYNWGSVNSFVSCSYDKTIRFWDLRASNSTSVIWPTSSRTGSRVTSVCVDPSGKLLVSGHENASLMLYDICGGRAVQIFRPHGDEVRTVRFSNAAYYLLSGSYDNRIVITDMRGNLAEPLSYLPVSKHRDKVIQCRWHPRDFVFLSTSADKTAVLWSLPPKSF